ncbi:MAG: polyphosphate kinase 1 [Planctomycetaceae bacterium]|nr:polyphosphate kinase 1 [Planctomycetota bacterium]NUN52889.1 polyphosphate kinase 1 [Planctomycetaceae bacterium]
MTPDAPKPAKIPLKKPEYLLNRELSWLAFNDRVLAEARDPEVPLLERVKFLAILSSNLDEFFMIRVAGLLRAVLSGDTSASPDGRSPQRQREEISAEVHRMTAEAMRVYREEIRPALARHGIRILDVDELDEAQRTQVSQFFHRDVFPVLTPLAVDPGHPFPHLFNKTINLAVVLVREDGSEHFGIVQVPRTLDRLVRLPAPEGEHHFLFLGGIIRMHLAELFPGYTVKSAHAFRVTRDGDLAIEEEEDDPLLYAIERQLRQREWGIAVRLEVEHGMPEAVQKVVIEAVDVDPLDVYTVQGPLQVTDLMSVASLGHLPALKDPPFSPGVRAPLRNEEDVFTLVSRGDVLLHHPYESFDTVVRFVREAAEDPGVLAIKQTLYRTSGDSPVVAALAKAAENGKQVTAIIELRARFDEGSNIAWARALERAGAHVIYGLVGLKTHCKHTLVVRREDGGLRRYAHLSTGNYNPVTARLYTDIGMLTADPDITADISDLFNLLTGYARPPKWRSIVVAPQGLKERMIELIDGERKEAEEGRPARIMAKMNSLVDREVIKALLQACRAGVPVDLVVRGICCVRPGVEGVSENLRIRSVVDRFLEHERVFVFGTGERMRMFLSSADWMPRNFLRRVELCWPVKDPALRKRIMEEILHASFNDNRKSWSLRADGTYEQVKPRDGEPVLRSQAWLIDAEHRAAATARAEKPHKAFSIRGTVSLSEKDRRGARAAARKKPAKKP